VAPVVWLPDEEPPQTTLDQAGADPVALCPPMTLDLRSITWGTDGRSAPQIEGSVHVGRISLARLPPNTAMLGGGGYVTVVGDRFLAEQLPPDVGRDPLDIDAIAPFDGLPVMEVDDEVLLIARYGIGAWRHWLAELLPKLVLAERAFPGRFGFVVPAEVCAPAAEGAIWADIRQSLELCGIETARLVPAARDHIYKFRRLFAVSPVMAEGVIHPHAAQAMRDLAAAIPASANRRLAIGRDGVDEAESAIEAALQARGFVVVRTGTLALAQRIAAFKGADRLFAWSGDELGSLVFAPMGVRVMTADATASGDPLIAALVRERHGQLTALLRGTAGPDAPAVQPGEDGAPQVFGAALDALGG
jgi:hypothetical protein